MKQTIQMSHLQRVQRHINMTMMICTQTAHDLIGDWSSRWLEEKVKRLARESLSATVIVSQSMGGILMRPPLLAQPIVGQQQQSLLCLSNSLCVDLAIRSV